MPAWATWNSAKDTGSRKGYVFREYWRNLQARMHHLRSEGTRLLRHPSCRLWNGFVESYPTYPYESDFRNEPGLCSFQDFVRLIASLQRDVRWLAAWVRMGQALIDNRFDNRTRIAGVVFGETQEGLMGVWVNGMSETMVAWFAQCGVPIFVAHEIQGDKDRPDNYNTLPKFDHPMKGSDLVGAPVIERWLKLSDGMLVAGYWDTGVDTNMATTKDQLSRWRSSPVASPSNFPGDSWYADSPASPQTQNIISKTSFVELPDAIQEWKGVSMGSAHGVTYLIPPPVLKTTKGKWEHFAEDQTLDGISAFFLVGQKNQSICEGMTYLFYDRLLRRILHCDGPLPIPKVVTHDTSIYGFPCPKVHFYQDSSLSRKLHVSSWLYTTKDALPGDIGRCAPLPSLERVSHLIEKDNPSPALTADDQSWSEDPNAVVTSIVPLDGDDILMEGNIEVDKSSTITNPVYVPSHEKETTPTEPDSYMVMGPKPNSADTDVQAMAETEYPESDTPGTDTIMASIPSSPSTMSSLSVGDSTDSSNEPVASGKRRLEDRIGDNQTMKRRRATFMVDRRIRPPAFGIRPSRIPNAGPLYSQITPYLCVNGIGHHTIEDLRAWLALTVHTLRITVVIKIRNRVGGGLFVLKFYDKEEAISFKCCYNLWTSKDGETWAIEYVSHRAVLCIPRERIIAQWQLREGGNLHPALDLDTPPEPIPRPSLIQRMGIPLEQRLTNSMTSGPSSASDTASSSATTTTTGARKRRGGKFRRNIQEIQGKPS